jgi:hypothetical protein
MAGKVKSTFAGRSGVPALVGEEDSVEGRDFPVGICNLQLLCTSRNARSYHRWRVGVFEGGHGGFATDGYLGSGYEAAAVQRDDAAADSWPGRRIQRADAQRYFGELDDGDNGILGAAICRGDGEKARAVFAGGKGAAVQA